MKKIIIIGGGGMSLNATMIIEDIEGMELLGYLDDLKPVGTFVGELQRYKVLGPIKDYKKYLERDDVYFFYAFAGFSDPKASYEQILEMNIPEEKLINIVHPQTYVSKNYTQVGKSFMMMPFSQLGPEVKVGNYCIMLGNSFVAHNTILGDFVHLASNAVVGSCSEVGVGTHFGTNCLTKENLKIGKYAIIGAGAVVVKDVPDYAIVVGNPAKVIKYRDIKELVEG